MEHSNGEESAEREGKSPRERSGESAGCVAEGEDKAIAEQERRGREEELAEEGRTQMSTGCANRESVSAAVAASSCLRT